MKNHELRPIGSQSFSEVNANTNTNSGLIEEGRELVVIILMVVIGNRHRRTTEIGATRSGK